jgi:hypothetical protein
MVANEDHYINRVLREPGTQDLTTEIYDATSVSLCLSGRPSIPMTDTTWRP